MNVILGLGKTGFSVLEYLQGQAVTVMDTRDIPPYLSEAKKLYSHAKIITGRIDHHILAVTDRIIVSPGIKINTPEFKKYRNKMIGDIELFGRAAKKPIIAITGTNGKTTVTTLVGLLLKEGGFKVEVGGNIGTPALDLLKRPLPDYYVLELSSFQLAVTRTLSPFAAVVLNITPDHLDWHESMEEYRVCKMKLYDRSEHLVIPDDLRRFAKNDGSPQKQETYLDSNLKVAGALAKLAGVSDEVIARVLKDFKGLPHRCEWLGCFAGVDWYDDSKATNVGATQAALESLGAKQPLILIAGGQAKTALDSLKPVIARTVKMVIGIGEAAPLFAEISPHYLPAESLKEAVEKAKACAVKGDAVLLSPACASFDMFKNYEDRGEQFKQCVREVYV